MKNVLIIESNTGIRENIAELLELSQFNILTAENGFSGFKSAKTNTPDIVICDMMEPQTGGDTFLWLAARDATTKHIPLILFTADPACPHASPGAGAYKKYLQKPFSAEDLIHAVDESLA
ncbi:MAG TPA: response regulator [Chitinophagaceae bacterium]|nr:response regulator [Chitinophagaceae bacterium]